MVSERTFVLGVNYWPRQTAMYWWHRFESEQVGEDFALLREAGLNYLRLFLLWEEFQPAPDRVSTRALDRLVMVADLAQAAEIHLMPTFFTGHMSGINWLPPWMLESRQAPSRFPIFSKGGFRSQAVVNFYGNREVRKIQRSLIREVMVALEGHPAIWAWDLGNELSNCVIPPTRQAALDWLAEMVEEVRRVDEVHPITLGMHPGDLEEDRNLGPAEAGRFCDFLSMHGDPIYADARWAEGLRDVWVPPFLGALTRWLGGKPVLFQELGLPTEPSSGRLPGEDRRKLTALRISLSSEEEMAGYYRQVLPLLLEQGVIGALARGYGDYDSSLWGLPPLDAQVHERFFGLFRADGSPKPAVAVLRDFFGQGRTVRGPDLSWIELPAKDYYQNPLGNLQRLYRDFRERFASFRTET